MPLSPTELDEADELACLLFRQHGVLSRRQAVALTSLGHARHQVAAGRWQQPHRAVYITHNGTVTPAQSRWIATLATGSGLLAGLSALEVHGLRGYRPSVVHVLLPAGQRSDRPPRGVAVRRTTHLPARDVHLAGDPPCTSAARSLIDAAQWAATDNEARAIVAAGFQQRLVGGDDIPLVLSLMPRARRRALVADAAADAAGGAHSLPEAEFGRLCRRHGIPRPTRQVRRVDDRGRPRYLDAYFAEWGLHVEIDGGQHTEVRAWWAEMRRQNELWIAGDRVLRFPAWAVRQQPAEVAAQVRAALWAAGWRP